MGSSAPLQALVGARKRKSNQNPISLMPNVDPTKMVRDSPHGCYPPTLQRFTYLLLPLLHL